MSLNEPATVPEVDAATALLLVRVGAVLLDVREPHEWQAGHVPGAVLVPLARVSEVSSVVPAGSRVVVLCRSGNRSRVGTEVLVAQGYDAVNLIGGVQALVQLGEPLVDSQGNAGSVL